MDDEIKTEELINLAFKAMCRIFPTFYKAWPTQEEFEGAKREWYKAFMQARLNRVEQIRYGIEKYRLLPNPFVPSPGQFIAMCKPTAEDLGLPSVHLAYREACLNSHPQAEKKWSHDAIYHAAKETGFHQLSTLPQAQSFVMFERNYEIITRKLLTGEVLTAIPKAIENKEIVKITPGLAQSTLKGMLDKLKG